jgi:hypothetical protein
VRSTGSNWIQIPIEILDGQESFLPIPEQSYFQAPLFYKMPGYNIDYARFLSLMVTWPPVITKLPLITSRGLLPWEKSPFDGLQVRWCESECTIQFLNCFEPDEQRELTLMAARPDLNDQDTLFVRIETHGNSKQIKFDKVNQLQDVMVGNNQKIDIHVERVFTSSTDPRPKGILLTQSRCTRLK